MDERHAAMWRIANSPEDVLEAIRISPEWSATAREFAAVKAQSERTYQRFEKSLYVYEDNRIQIDAETFQRNSFKQLLQRT